MLTSNWKGDYYLEADGKMATSKWVDNENYYVDETGKWDKSAKKKLGWIKVNEDWYYYEVKDQMSTSKWAGHYYLLADGKMAKNQWVDNNQYFVITGKVIIILVPMVKWQLKTG